MTDAELDAMTAPDYFADAPPMFTNLGGFFFSEVDPPERVHRCGRCNNQTGIFNPECPNRGA